MNPKRKSVPRRAVRRLLKKFSFHSADVLEERQLLSASTVLPAGAVEPIGGTGNNVENPTWGAAGNDLIRLTPAQYANGYSTPSLPQDPSPRLISNIVNNQADPANPSQDIATVNQQSLSDFAYSFGQFMDHDMDLTLGNGASDPIPVPVGDPIGGPNDTPLAFALSNTDPATGTGLGNPAQEINSITSYFDLSQVYGSDLGTDNALRTFVGGQMKTSPGGLPPLDNSTYFTSAQLAAINASVGGMADDGPAPPSQMFVTGDSRGNENVELTVLQTLFLDNHNRIAAELQEENPTWTDRAAVRCGPQGQYRAVPVDHLQRVDSRRAGDQCAARLPGLQPQRQRQHRERIFDGRIPLRPQPAQRGCGAPGEQRSGRCRRRAAWRKTSSIRRSLTAKVSRPTIDPVTGLATTSIGAVLKGDADGDAQAEDTQVINEVRDELFNEVVPGVGYGQDLIALDIQRGRVNGIGSYNQVRESLGLPAVTSFSQITSNVTSAEGAAGGLRERQQYRRFRGRPGRRSRCGFRRGAAVPGDHGRTNSRGSETATASSTSMRHSPRRSRRSFNQGNTLTKVIEANTNITNLQSDAFIFQASIGGSVSMSLGGGGRQLGIPGITVQLEDTSGDILATTTTGRNGQYSFNQLSGPATNVENASGVSGTGTYEIVLSLPSWLEQTGSSPGAVTITRGGQNVTGVNFNIGINWNDLTTTPDAQTAAANLASLVSATRVESTGAAGRTTATPATSTSLSSGSAVQASADTTTATASPTAKSGELTPASLVTYLESLGRAATTGAAGSSAHGAGSPPATDWMLDSAFAPSEFAKIVDQLS